MKRFFIFCVLCFISLNICCGSMQKYALATDELEITSKSAFLMDFSSKEILYEKNSTQHLPVASMVKMMTILLSLEDYYNKEVALDTKITVSENASGMGGSQVFLDAYSNYTFEELLKSVIMASANDASVALAEYFSGSEKAFVKRMNKKAKELGMKDTNYVNCTGLPIPEQYSCAKDSAILLSEVLKYDIYHNYSNVWMDELNHPSGRKTELVNTNRLIRYYKGCDSGKTGSTNEAGCCLTASAQRDGMRLISVVVGAENSKTRFNECSTLFNYGFANFENEKIIDSSISLCELSVNKGKKENVEIYAKEDFSMITRKGDNSDYQINKLIPKKLNAPTKKGDVVGKIQIIKNGVVIREIDVIVNENIEKLSLFDSIGKIVENW
ncbi:MAG: D-alanyl-D-alanine carboxypeptidase [Clostridia bacterium]|nr:D-alanyl-D-alanine carboxypeptidase [Clostridia bacterium]